MEVVEFDIKYSSRSEEFRFHPIGDIHLGSIESSESEIEKAMQQILNDDHAYIIGKGDYADCITKNDPRFDGRNLAPWVVKDNIVESQREKVVNLFKPAAKEGKVITLLTGNHEEEIHMRHDNDMIRNECKDLGVPYGGYQCFVLLRFNRMGHDIRTVVWHAWHGAGSAQTEGARLMRLMRLVNDIEADIFSMGHIHGAITTYTPDQLFYNMKVRKIQSRKKIATLSGSWVRAYMQSTEESPLNPHYSEKKGYKPSRIGCPIIHIRPNSDEMWITA